METPREDEDTQNSDPALEELKQELSDADLQEKGILFAAKYILCRMIMANGYDSGKKIPFQDVDKRLKQLFPQQEEERLPNYLQHHSDIFNVAFDWASKLAYEEWKVSRVKAQLKKLSPDLTDEKLEFEARARVEFDNLSKATVQAAEKLGITGLNDDTE